MDDAKDIKPVAWTFRTYDSHNDHVSYCFTDRESYALMNDSCAVALYDESALLKAKEEGRREGLREAIGGCMGEYLVEPTDSADDIAYNTAVTDCINTITRKLDVK